MNQDLDVLQTTWILCSNWNHAQNDQLKNFLHYTITMLLLQFCEIFEENNEMTYNAP